MATIKQLKLRLSQAVARVQKFTEQKKELQGNIKIARSEKKPLDKLQARLKKCQSSIEEAKLAVKKYKADIQGQKSPATPKTTAASKAKTAPAATVQKKASTTVKTEVKTAKKAAAKTTSHAKVKAKATKKPAAKVVAPVVESSSSKSSWPEGLSNFLRSWLDGRQFWDHGAWLNLLEQLKEKGYQQFAQDNTEDIGLFLETNRAS
jgi:chromosome segregation ATPase